MLFFVLDHVFWLDLIDFWGSASVKRVVVSIRSAEMSIFYSIVFSFVSYFAYPIEPIRQL